MDHPATNSGRTGIRIDITLGMPKYNCRFHGICRLDVDETDIVQPALLPCGRARGWLYQPHPEFCLICFDARSMTECSRVFHFGRAFFALPESIAAGQSLRAKLGSRLVLREGRYRINRKGDYFTVLFRIRC
ncbi:MAG: hypothetical protein R2824_11025 [Saprospiraceae bacterium]|nr:hypothetical protein [Lewinella sp.]